jgi:hypothetical protein
MCAPFFAWLVWTRQITYCRIAGVASLTAYVDST